METDFQDSFVDLRFESFKKMSKNLCMFTHLPKRKCKFMLLSTAFTSLLITLLIFCLVQSESDCGP